MDSKIPAEMKMIALLLRDGCSWGMPDFRGMLIA